MATIKDLMRMCKEHHCCIGCPIFYLEGCMLYRLPSNLDDIVDKWVEEHPLKSEISGIICRDCWNQKMKD